MIVWGHEIGGQNLFPVFDQILGAGERDPPHPFEKLLVQHDRGYGTEIRGIWLRGMDPNQLASVTAFTSAGHSQRH